MKRTAKFVLRVEPLPNESFSGFLARFAAKNYLHTTARFYELLGLDRQGALGKMAQASENIAHISTLLSVTPERLSQMLPTFTKGNENDLLINGLELKANHFSRRHRRVSPASLRMSTHHRINWQLKDLPFCPESWEVLINRCPAPECRAYLSWGETSGPHICEKCGFDLRNASTETILVEDRPTLRFVADLVSHDSLENQRAVLPLHPSLRHLNRGVLLQLISLFGRAEAGLHSGRNVRKQLNMIAYPDMQIRGAQILRGYPQSILEIIKTRHPVVMPKLFLALKTLTGPGCSEATNTFLQEMMVDLRPGAQSTTEGLSSVRKELDMLTARETAALLRVERRIVRHLIDIGALKPYHHRGAMRESCWHLREEVVALADKMADRIAVNTVHSRYRLPVTAIEQLVDLGLLRWHPCQAVRDTYMRQYLVKSEFEIFRQQLDAVVELHGALNTDRVQLSELFAMIGPVSKPWGNILDLAIKKTLPGGLKMVEIELGYRASNLTVNRSLLAKVQKGHAPWQPIAEPPRKRCTQLEAEERLACFSVDIQHLIESGYLQRISPDSSSLVRKTVLETVATFISSREIAARLGIAATNVGGWANRKKLRHPIPKSRFYLRAEAEFWLPPNLYTKWHESEGSGEIASKQSLTDDETEKAGPVAA